MLNINKITILLIIVLVIMLGFLLTGSINEVEDIYENDPIVVDGMDGLIVSMVEDVVDESIKRPGLNREVFDLTERSMNRLNELIKKEDLSIDDWLEIGLFWKSGGNFEAAREAWEYVDAISVNNNIAQINLGNLYVRDMVDLEKAESWYKKALISEPKYPVTYFQMAEMYLYGFKDRNKAINIAKQGLRELPNDDSLKSLRDVLESGGSI